MVTIYTKSVSVQLYFTCELFYNKHCCHCLTFGCRGCNKWIGSCCFFFKFKVWLFEYTSSSLPLDLEGSLRYIICLGEKCTSKWVLFPFIHVPGLYPCALGQATTQPSVILPTVTVSQETEKLREIKRVFVWWSLSNQLLSRSSAGDGPGRTSGFRPPAPGLPAQPQPVHRSVRPEQARGDSSSLSVSYPRYVSLFVSHSLSARTHVNHFTDGCIPPAHWCKHKHPHSKTVYLLNLLAATHVDPVVCWRIIHFKCGIGICHCCKRPFSNFPEIIVETWRWKVKEKVEKIATAVMATSASDLCVSAVWRCNVNMWVKHVCDLWPPACVWLQWIISELACYTYSMVVVPLYDTLGPDAIRFIINTGENTHTSHTHTQTNKC